MEETSEPAPARRSRRRLGRWAVRVDEVDRVAIDLGPGGVFVRDLLEHEPGAELGVVLWVDAREVRLRATVQWVRRERLTARIPAGAGLAFRDLDDETRRLLAAALEEEP